MQDSRIRYKKFLPPASCLQTRSFVLHAKENCCMLWRSHRPNKRIKSLLSSQISLAWHLFPSYRRPYVRKRSGLLIEVPSQILDLAEYPQQNQEDIYAYIRRYVNSLYHSSFRDFLSKQVSFG